MATLSNQETLDHVGGVVFPIAAAMGLEIVELKVGFHRSDILIQVFADRPLGGITIEECTAINKSIVEAIDAAGVLPPDNFSVEVASPGLDRPLTTYKDFLRNLNYNIRLFLKTPVEGKKEVAGVLTAVTAGDVTLVNAKQQVLVIPLENILRGLLVL